MNPILQNLQNKQWVWTAANAKQHRPITKLATGFQNLDKVLTGGFPGAGMIHLRSPLGCGELRLMLSILKQHQQAAEQQKLVVFINPPFELNAEFLLEQELPLSQIVIVRPTKNEDALWSAEQCAKSGACCSIFIWQKTLKHVQVRKLEHAANQGACYCVWMDSLNQQISSSKKSEQGPQNLPLSLSLSLSREDEELSIKVNKQKVGWAQKAVKVPLPFNSRTNQQLKAYRANKNARSQIVPIRSSR